MSQTLASDNELLTIAEAARRLGLHRPKLSILLKDAGVMKTTVDGKEMISYEDARQVHDEALRRGRVRPDRRLPRTSNEPSFTLSEELPPLRETMETLLDHFRTEIARLHVERDELSARVSALEIENRRLAGELEAKSSPSATDFGALAGQVEPLDLVQAVVDRTLELIRQGASSGQQEQTEASPAIPPPARFSWRRPFASM